LQGIGERNKFYEQQEELPEGFPARPNTLTLEVNMFGVVYTAYLALHFFRKNESKGGKIVMTSSASALYPAASLSLYASAKHAVGFPSPLRGRIARANSKHRSSA
jgi:15-hydroxyprostaglandin dehydrogenase (NAD)